MTQLSQISILHIQQQQLQNNKIMFARQKQLKNEVKKNQSSLLYHRKSLKITPRISYTQQNRINKIASIRTLPPFAHIGSGSGVSSKKQSNGCSETDSQIWKQQQSGLFDYQQKNSIEAIDQQLQQVIGTIRKQRNIIDIKIWKLHQKIQELQKVNKVKQKRDNKDVGISTQNLRLRQILDSSFEFMQYNEQYAQFPQKIQHSAYFKLCCNNLDLKQQIYQGVSEQEAANTNESIKIEENKLILEMLMDKLGS